MNKTEVAKESLSDALVMLMENLGYGAEKLWTLYVQAQQAQAISNLVFLVMMTIFIVVSAYIGYRFAKRFNEMKKKEYESDRRSYRSADDVDEQFNIVMGVFISVTLGAFFGAMVSGFVTNGIILKLIAPEYTAAQELITELNRLT